MLNRNFYTLKMIKDLCQIGYVPYNMETLNLLNGNYITFPNGDKAYQFFNRSNSSSLANGTGAFLQQLYVNVYSKYDLGPIYDSNYGGTKVVIGSGSAQETFEDFNMEVIIKRSEGNYKVLAGSTMSRAFDENNQTMTYTFPCQALKDITVREIGLSESFEAIANSPQEILIYRKVLDAPIEISAGQLFSVNISIDIPIPFIKEPTV